jgi:potassium/sodium efflux P-type ATPase
MGVQRMSRRSAIIKKLSSVETLGSTTVICTDKTGTLTQNAMTVREIWLPDQALTVTGSGYEPEGQFTAATSVVNDPSGGDLGELLRGALLCNNARLVDGRPGGSGWGIIGDPTEAALVVAAAKAGMTAENERETLPRAFELPFDSRRKRMATVHRQGDTWLAYVKGAPNEILKICTCIQDGGSVRPLTDADCQRILAANDGYAQAALRVLAVARRHFAARPQQFSVETVETGLTFLGLLAMMDPPRPEVTDAVMRCRSAGIRTVMITGDYGLTAISIGRKIGLVQGRDVRIITGSELETMDDASLAQALDEQVIFARVAPEHKLRVVTAFQAKGHIVAVTGDGVNDAPALKKADIGVAMGISGTDVAKEAADMILTDDNFASIVNAVEEGRAVYENIKKFVTYILASNVPELIPFVAMVLFNLPLGLTVMQILAIDLGTDMLPALALGVEKPEPGIMNRPPRPRHKRLVDGALFLRAYGWLGVIETALAFVGFFALIQAMGYSPFNLYADCAALGEGLRGLCVTSGVNGLIRVDLLPYAARMALDVGLVYVLATTIFHAGVVFAQIGNAFACRTETYSVFAQEGLRAGVRWLVSSRFLLVGVAVEVVTMVLMVYVEPFKAIFEHAELAGQWWLLLMGYGPVLFVLEEARKAAARRWKRRSAAVGT